MSDPVDKELLIDYKKELAELKEREATRHQRQIDCTDEIWDVLIKHFGDPDDPKSRMIECPEVFARIFGSLIYKDGSDSDVPQMFAWTIDSFVTRRVSKLIPVFDETYRMLNERGHTKNHKYEWNDLDNHAWYIPHKDFQIIATTDQNHNFIFRRGHDKSPEGSDPLLYSILRNDFFCFRYWDMWDDKDDFEQREHKDIQEQGKPLAIRLAYWYVERYADDYPGNNYPDRHSFPWFEDREFDHLGYEDCRDAHFVFGWRQGEHSHGDHTHSRLGIIGVAFMDLLGTHKHMLLDKKPIVATTKRLKNIRHNIGLDASLPLNPVEGLEEKTETRYDRAIGILCRVCGTPSIPTYMGNVQTGYHCPKCDEDFDT